MQGGGMINCSAIRGSFRHEDGKNLCRKVHICDKTRVFSRNDYWREGEGYIRERNKKDFGNIVSTVKKRDSVFDCL